MSCCCQHVKSKNKYISSRNQNFQLLQRKKQIQNKLWLFIAKASKIRKFVLFALFRGNNKHINGIYYFFDGRSPSRHYLLEFLHLVGG